MTDDFRQKQINVPTASGIAQMQLYWKGTENIHEKRAHFPEFSGSGLNS